jgi:carbamoyltransferase
MNILGISAYYHDSAACLIINGHIVAAAQEERFTRKNTTKIFQSKRLSIVYGRVSVTPLILIM